MSIAAPRRPPSALALSLLRVQYWYDRLSEPQRLVSGLAVLLMLGACSLYVLGIGSMILVSRVQPPTAADAAGLEPTAEPVIVYVMPTSDSGQPTQAPTPGTATPIPTVDASGELIEPPDVPEVAIIPPAPRAVSPIQPLKPRVIAATPTVVHAAATAAPSRSALGAPTPTPLRTAVPTSSAVVRATPSPVRTTVPLASPGNATAPSRPPVVTPNVPTVAPTPVRQPAVAPSPGRRP